MEDWNIQIRNDSCASCQKMFEAKTACFTVLVRNADGYQRQDWCGLCWENSGGAMIREKAGVVSLWQGTYEPPAPPPPDPLPKEDAESILRRMMARHDPLESEAKYILAVMLERKRIFKHRETRLSSPPMLVYEHTGTGEVFMIEDPQLKLDRLEEVQTRVAAMLKPSSSPEGQG